MKVKLSKERLPFLGTVSALLLPFLIYLTTLAPGLTLGDGGEMIAAAYFLGVPHPSGFPLWVILNHFFTLLPGPNVAWTVNLASAVFGSFASLLLYLILRSHIRWFLALPVALAFALTKTVWFYSSYAEVWSLMLVIIFLLIFLMQLWEKTGRDKYLYWAAFVSGLSLTVHYLALVIFPAILILVLWREKGAAFRLPRLFILLVLFILGLTPFLIFPLRSQMGVAIDWGQTGRSIENFVDYMRRKQFGAAAETDIGLYLPVKLPEGSVVSLVTRLFTSQVTLWRNIERQLTWPVLLVGLIGLFSLFRRRSAFIFLATAFLFSGPVNYFFNTPAFEDWRFDLSELTPFLAIFVIVIGFGWQQLYSFVAGVKPILRYGIIILAFAWFGYFLVQNRAFADLSHDYTATYHGENLLKTVDQGAILVTKENNWFFPLVYFLKVEGRRPDLTVYDYNANLLGTYFRVEAATGGLAGTLAVRSQKVKELINGEKQPVYFAVDKPFENNHYEVSREGILYKGSKVPTKEIDFYRAYRNILDLPVDRTGDTDGQYIKAYYHVEYGNYLLAKGQREKMLAEYALAIEHAPSSPIILNNVATQLANIKEYTLAATYYERLLQTDQSTPMYYYNLASVYEEQGRLAAAEDFYRKALELKTELKTVLALSSLYERKGDISKALQGYRIALQLDPQNGYAKNRVEILSGK